MVAPDSDNSALLSALQACVGAAHVCSPATHAQADWQPYARDWRKRHCGLPLAVVQPAHTDEAAQLMRLCHAHKVPVVLQGGNTGLVLGGVPDHSGQEVVISTRRMQRIRAVDTANMTLTAEAGCTLAQVQAAAAQAGALFPLSLASEGSCTIGGNLATNAGGTQVLRYGNSRDLCLGLEVVTPQGEIWQGLSGLRKDNTGYDLRHLYVGSEGTLGLITAATLKLFAPPSAQLTAWVTLGCLDDAVALLQGLRQAMGDTLTAFEVMNDTALALVQRHFGAQVRWPCAPDSPFAALVEISVHGHDPTAAQAALGSALAHAMDQGWARTAVLAHQLSQSQQMWHIRECITLAQAQEGLNIKHDIALPISALAAFCAHTSALLAHKIEGVRLVNFGHLGDGNLHFNVQCPEGADGAAFLERYEAPVNAWVFEAVKAHGGSISAEHGIGALKAATLPHYKDPTALSLMRHIKTALDPHHLLGRGRVLQNL